MKFSYHKETASCLDLRIEHPLQTDAQRFASGHLAVHIYCVDAKSGRAGRNVEGIFLILLRDTAEYGGSTEPGGEGGPTTWAHYIV